MALKQRPSATEAARDIEVIIPIKEVRWNCCQVSRDGASSRGRWCRGVDRDGIGKFWERGQRAPLGAAFRLQKGIPVRPALSYPLADQVGGYGAVLLPVAAYYFVH